MLVGERMRITDIPATMVIKTLAWVGCIGGIVGAFLVANEMRFGYIPFFIGAIAYCIVAYQKKDKPLLLLNLVYAIANLNGLIRWL